MLVLSLFRISIVTFSALHSFTTAGHSNFLLINRTTSGRTAGTTSTTPLLDPSRALKMNSDKRYIKICRGKYLTKNLSRFVSCNVLLPGLPVFSLEIAGAVGAAQVDLSLAHPFLSLYLTNSYNHFTMKKLQNLFNNFCPKIAIQFH